jgi:hypothetical protein
VDYQTAQNQALLLQQQAFQVTQEIKGLADKLQVRVPDPNLARELMMDLRQAALAIQQQNQSAVSLIQQMAEYIHALETNLYASQQPQMVPMQPMQPRGWYEQPYPSTSGGFMGNVASSLGTGLGLGVGIGVGEEVVDSIFGRW